MRFSAPLIWATFHERQNRFAAQVDLAGKSSSRVSVHIPSSGRMRELLYPGAPVGLLAAQGPERTTAYDLVLARHEKLWVSVDTRVPNQLIREAWEAGELPEFASYTNLKPEVTFGVSRFDFLLAGPVHCYLEVKSVTLVHDGMAMFPDAPSQRGARHLMELARVVEAGEKAAVMFVIQRPDAQRFSPNREGDPHFADALEYAARAGVKVLARKCRVDESGVYLEERVAVEV